MGPWNVIVNENMLDAGAWVVHDDEAFPLGGWERVWSTHTTRQEAEAALPAARDYADGRRLP